MTLDELKDEINESISRAGFETNGDTWKKEGVAYLLVEQHETGLAISGRVFTDDGLSYTFVSAPLMYRFARSTFTNELADTFLTNLLYDAKLMAECGKLPVYERKGAL